MANLSDFISTIATNLNIANLDGIKLLLASPELTKIEMPAEFIDGFNGKYLTEESAKANPTIKTHFFQNALDPIDRAIKTTMEELEFSQEDKDEINKLKSTYSKNEMLIKKLKTMSSKSTSEEDKAKFTKEIQRLNGELAQKDLATQKAIQDNNTNWSTKLSALTLKNKIMSHPLYTSDVQRLKDTYLIANNRLEEALQEKGAKMIFDNDEINFKLVQKDNPDLDYVENHKKVDADSFIAKVLADNKLLKTTQQSAQPPVKQPVYQNANNGGGDKQLTPQQRRIQASLEADLKNLQEASNGQ